VAVVQRYVNPASSVGGDGTAKTTTGSTRSYASRSDWEAAEDGAGSGTDDHQLEIWGDGEDSDGWCSIAGWNVNSITIEVDEAYRHSAKYETGVARYYSSYYYGAYEINEPDVTIIGDCVKVDGDSGRGVGFHTSSSGTQTIQQCLFYNAKASPGSGVVGLDGNAKTTPTSTTYRFFSNIIHEFYRGIKLNSKNSQTYEIIWNTIADCTNRGIDWKAYGSTDRLDFYNNLMDSNGTDYVAESTWSTFNHGENVTSDATSPDGASFQNKTIVFIGSGDYHIDWDTDTNDLHNSGSDRTSYFAEDIDGETIATDFHIGADWKTADSGVTGDIAQSASLLGQSATGSVPVSGDVAQSMSLASQSASGSVPVSGDASQSASLVSQAATGSVPVSGDVAQSLSLATQSGTGSVKVAGDAAQTASLVSQAASGSVPVSGDAAQSASLVSQSASGTVDDPAITGDITQSASLVSQAAQGSVGITGGISQDLSVLSQSASGTIPVTGDITQAASLVSQSASGSVVVPLSNPRYTKAVEERAGASGSVGGRNLSNSLAARTATSGSVNPRNLSKTVESRSLSKSVY
jgi:hypothetical protein